MFDEFGPRGAEDEREGFWTDLSEVPDEQYRDEDEPKQTQEVIVPPAQEPYGPRIHSLATVRMMDLKRKRILAEWSKQIVRQGKANGQR